MVVVVVVVVVVCSFFVCLFFEKTVGVVVVVVVVVIMVTFEPFSAAGSYLFKTSMYFPLLASLHFLLLVHQIQNLFTEAPYKTDKKCGVTVNIIL